MIVILYINANRFVGNEFKIEFYKLLKADGMTVPISRSIEPLPRCRRPRVYGKETKMDNVTRPVSDRDAN